jgi:diacylglycerol kinase (ATP)
MSKPVFKPVPKPVPKPLADPAAESAFKSKGGLRRVWHAATYSAAGFRAALRHEAAFRQELLLGVPLIVLAPFIAPGRWQLLAMVGSVVLVLIVELINSAIEALADAVSLDRHALLGRAKDLGSAAVMLSLLGVAFTWALVLWPRR